MAAGRFAAWLKTKSPRSRAPSAGSPTSTRKRHYTVARLDEDGGPGVTVVGTIFPVAEGEEIRVSGVWKRHARYGLQFQVQQWQKIDPATLEGIEKYLGSGMIKGIGPTYAKRLVAAFGLDTLRVLSEEPLRILDVDGIGEARARRIMEAWQAQRGMQDVMVFLQGHGVGASLALRIYRVFGADDHRSGARKSLRAGAQRCTASAFCWPTGSPIKSASAVIFRCACKPACCTPYAKWPSAATVLPSLRRSSATPPRCSPSTKIRSIAAVSKLAARGDLVLHEAEGGATQVYLEELYHAERRVAAALGALLATPSTIQREKIPSPWDGAGDARGAIDLISPELFATFGGQVGRGSSARHRASAA